MLVVPNTWRSLHHYIAFNGYGYHHHGYHNPTRMQALNVHTDTIELYSKRLGRQIAIADTQSFALQLSNIGW